LDERKIEEKVFQEGKAKRVNCFLTNTVVGMKSIEKGGREMKEKEEERLWNIVPGYDFIEEIDMADASSWFLDEIHRGQTPLSLWFWIKYCCNGFRQVAETLSIPTFKGFELRLKRDGDYGHPHIVSDKEEIRAREVKFRAALKPWLENFDGLWGTRKEELLNIYSKLKELDVEKASNIDLYHYHYDLARAYQRVLEIHFEGLYTSNYGWILLEDLMKERFYINDQSPEFTDMMRGFDNKIYQVDRQLWEFGRFASEMGLADIFRENDPKAVISKLEETDRGKDWVKKFLEFLQVEGWRMLSLTDFTEPYWLEEPSIPLEIVRQFIIKGTSFALDDIRRDLTIKRESAVAALLAKVQPDEKEVFGSLIGLAQKCSSYSEEHDLYCELYINALLRRAYLEIGKRLAQAGSIDKPEDILMLNFDEIERVIIRPDRLDMRSITRARNAMWAQWRTMPLPPVITNRSSIEEAFALDMMPAKDAVGMKVVVGELPVVKPELNADLYGLCGSPGVVEGVARVVRSYEELQKVQPGEIIVCPASNPSWTPVFGIIKGVVADRGGTLSHTAIIGREFGIPVVVNTFQATAKIKTGQRIRVDGNAGTVHILG
jgi:pyruvate,water dikinase